MWEVELYVEYLQLKCPPVVQKPFVWMRGVWRTGGLRPGEDRLVSPPPVPEALPLPDPRSAVLEYQSLVSFSRQALVFE